MDPQVLLVYILMCTSTKCLIPILSKCQHAATQQLPYILERSLNWVVHRPDDQLVQSMLLRISHLSPSLAQLDSLTLYAILINKNSKIKKNCRGRCVNHHLSINLTVCCVKLLVIVEKVILTQLWDYLQEHYLISQVHSAYTFSQY